MYYVELAKPKVPSINSSVASIGKIPYLTWGSDDKYPLFINNLYIRSALHAGIVNGKVLRLTKRLPTIDKSIDVNMTAKDTITELLHKCLFDYETKNAFAIKVKRNKAFRRNIYEYVSVDNVRMANDGENYLLIDYSGDKKTIKGVYPNYFTSNADESLAVYYGEKLNYYDYKKNQYVQSYYPLPPYVGGIEAIMTDIEISSFHLNEISNSFIQGAMINFSNGIPPTDEEKQEIINRFRRQIENRDNVGGVIITFSNGKETEPQIFPLNGNDLDTRYLTLAQDVQQRILTAHTVTSPLLFGIKTSGQLGGATELQEAEEIFTINYIEPRFDKFKDFVSQIIKEVSFTAQPVTQSHKGIEEKEIINLIEQRGIALSNVKQISDAVEFDRHSMDEFLKLLQFEEKVLTDKQDKVLSYMLAGESITKISQLTGYSADEIYEVLRQLQRLKALDDDYVPTRKAKSMISDKVMSVFYVYKVKPEFGEPIIPTTREFCRRMIKHTETKALTRKDIDEISRRVGRDVWYYRGGWYHNPTDGVNYPHCRHYWYQFVGIVDKKLL